MRARQECVRHAQSAEKLEAHMAEAYAIDAICSATASRNADRKRALRASNIGRCEQRSELDSDNPRVG